MSIPSPDLPLIVFYSKTEDRSVFFRGSVNGTIIEIVVKLNETQFHALKFKHRECFHCTIKPKDYFTNEELHLVSERGVHIVKELSYSEGGDRTPTVMVKSYGKEEAIE